MYGDARNPTLFFWKMSILNQPGHAALSVTNNSKEIAMNTSPTTPPRVARHHPLMIAAALAVVLFCLLGTAAIMGWLPSSIGSNAANRPLSEADRIALAANLPQGAAPAALAPAPQYPVQPVAPQYPAQAAAPQYPAQPLAPQYPAQPVSQPYPAQQLAYADTAPRHAASKPVHVAASEPARNWCANCGNIESIRTITTRARGSGVGAGAGAVVGGLLGNQIGSGNGRTLATAAGAVGGAVVGNQVEGNMKASTSYEIRVRLDDGKLRTFHQHSVPPWRQGERVRIVKGSIRAA
jgi:outer membrane lipoprotein SlyB